MISNEYLDKVWPFLRETEPERRKKFYIYFQNAPLWLIDCVSVERISKGTIFLREGDPVDTMYFIAKGVIKGTDVRIYGMSFDYMISVGVYAYGGMELLMGLERYQTSLQALTDCIVLKIPTPQFAKWLNSDISALAQEARLMGGYLLEQTYKVRAFLFLQGADRLAMLLKTLYELDAPDGVLRLATNRQELSDFTGLSVKTITRAVQKLRRDGLVRKEGRVLVVNEEQYLRIKENLSQVLSEE